MRYLLLLLIIFFSFFIGKAQPKAFTVEHNGTSSIYYNLDTALKYAQSGDVINLPGGTISFSGQITKSVSLIGAGYDADSSRATAPTKLTSPGQEIIFSNGLNNIYMAGVELMVQTRFPESSSLSSLTLERCLTSSVYLDGSIQDLYLKECIIKAGIIGYRISNILANNCVFYSNFQVNNATVNNSLFFRPGGGWFYYAESSKTTNSTFNSCIIYEPSPSPIGFSGNGNTYNNNVFNAPVNSSSQPSGQNNIFGIQLSAIFLNSVSTTYTAQNKFHLAANSPAKNVGVNGDDCGIYDGPSPFKEGGMPFNPHIQSANVPSSSDLNGNLIINMKVKGQAD